MTNECLKTASKKKKNIPPRPRFIIISRAFYRSATVANRWRQKRAAECVYFIYFFFSSSLPTGSSCAEKCRRAASSSSFTTHQTRCRSARRARRHTTTSISCSAGRTRACPPDVIVAFARDEIGKIDRSIDRSRARAVDTISRVIVDRRDVILVILCRRLGALSTATTTTTRRTSETARTSTW